MLNWRIAEVVFFWGVVVTASAEMTCFVHNGKINTYALIGQGRQIVREEVGKVDAMANRNFGDHWNIEFSGILKVDTASDYEFILTSDDGSALFVNGDLVINNDGLHGARTVKGDLKLPAGSHQINLLYFNYTGGHALKATLQPGGGVQQELAAACTPSDKRQDLRALRESIRKQQNAQTQKALISVSTPAALTRSITHILKTRPRDYKNGREFLKLAKDFEKTMPAILKSLENDDSVAVDALDRFADLKFKALIAENPCIDFDEIVVVLSDKLATKSNWLGTHVIRPKGYNNKIARCNLRTGAITDVYMPDDKAYLGEIDLHWDVEKLLFTSTDNANMFQVMEVGLDGSGCRQVSSISGEFVHNYGGVYLPNEKIVFSSTAPLIGVPCISGSRTVPNLYIMDADGDNTRQLTFEQDADWYPSVLADGKIMYLRWEYTDIMHYYSRIMMTMNPDGTNQRAIYGSQSLWPNSMFNARPLPGQPGKFAAVVSGHHGVAGIGKLTIFDTNKGYAHADGVVQHIPGYGKEVTHVTVDQIYPVVKKELLEKFPELQSHVDRLIAEKMPESQQKDKDYHELNNDFFNKCYPELRDIYPHEMALDLDRLVDGVYPQVIQPYPVNDNYFLTVARLTDKDDWALYLVDTFDNFVRIKPVDMQGFKYMVEPYPLRRRERPPIIPEQINLDEKEAVCYIQNVYRGPGLDGVPEGVVDSLRIFTYAYGYYRTGNHHHIGIESGWDVKRLLGTVKVEQDGSTMFRIPANTTISLQPLDKEGRAIQLFRSWLVAMPGERLSCIGCHEPPTEPPYTRRTIASGKAPQKITPHRDRLEGYAYNAEIQPVLDAYCVRCHDGTANTRPDFKDTSLARNNSSANYSKSYYAFHRFFRRPGPESNGLMENPYEYHASTSEGIQLIEKGHHGVKLDQESLRRLYTWIDLNVPFYGSWSTAYAGDQKKADWTADISQRAAQLRSKYALVDTNWEYTPSEPYPVELSSEKAPQMREPAAVTLDGWPFDAESARLLQQQSGQVKREVDFGDGLKITMVRIPAGEFIMGSDSDTPQEQPRHSVRIDSPFWMSESEINNALYFKFNPDHNASVFDQQWKDHVRLGYYANYNEQPAVRMNWNEARAFCEWASRQSGSKFTLPSEAQWEWACRAGSGSAMFFGDKTDDFSQFANLADNSIQKFAVSGVNPVFNPKLVGNPLFDFIPRVSEFNDKQFLITGTKQYRPNPWGLYDMHGNVAEWTRSDYVGYPYRHDRSNSMNATSRKTVRGGSFFDRPHRATSSWRYGYLPWQRVFNVGFRVVIEE